MTTYPEYSESELLELADAAYKRSLLRCPRCESRVKARFLGAVGRATEPVLLRCERCGASGEYSPEHLEAMKLSWSREQKIRIVERYWSRRRVTCPNDGAVLRVVEAKILKPPPPIVDFRCPHCGRHFRSNEVEDIQDPESFEGQFDEGEVLGRGGMGEVLLAYPKNGGEVVAAKRIRPEFFRLPDAVRRFQRESRILAALSHPNIVEVRTTFIDDRGGVLVMEYVSGGSLKDAINDSLVTRETLVEYFADLTTGLEYLHREGVIHRDLKPDNVLLAERGATVADFGLARLVDRDTTRLTKAGAFLGTPLYAAPEQQLDSGEVTAACDIYALGLMAYEIATRQSPYRTPIDVSRLPEPLKEVIRAALDEDPVLRPAVSVLRSTLEEALR